MCGIAGGWWAQRASGQMSALHDALQVLHRRGPDDRGCEEYSLGDAMVALGHTRLSVIDLSAAGHQPMHSADANLSLIFNGEIYNYRELRAQLEAEGCLFVSDSDTEVLLQAWQRWGERCLTRLVGMFAFAVLDKTAGTLTCVRDAFGVKPLFYAVEEGAFLFGSEAAAVNRMRRHKVSLDWQRAYDYLMHADYDSQERTFFAGVLHLPAAHLVVLDTTSGQLAAPRQWWSPDIAERSTLSLDEAAEEVRGRFLDSVRLHLRSDVPLGAALSGGLDSSAIVCAMRHVEPDLPIQTFSYIAKGSALSEEVWADRINQHTGAGAHKVFVSADELVADLDDLIRTQGEPFGSTSIYAQYRVFQLARENGVTVTLDGQGADEMLAGYNGYPGQRVRSLIEKGRFAEALHFLNEWSAWPGRSRRAGATRAAVEVAPAALQNRVRSILAGGKLPEWLKAGPLREAGIVVRPDRVVHQFDGHGRRVMEELALALTRRGLPALLRHGDRNSMRFSVESRVPFLTPELVQLLLSLPEHYLISPQGETKHVFRKAMRGIVPDEVLDRRDKVGFATPEREWLLSIAPLAREWLADDTGLPFLDQPAMVRHFDSIVAGRRPFTWQVWRWINFIRWHHMFCR